jgi:hypothetical protein
MTDKYRITLVTINFDDGEEDEWNVVPEHVTTIAQVVAEIERDFPDDEWSSLSIQIVRPQND